MKKKLFLTLALSIVLVCLFAIGVSAAENYNAEYTLDNQTILTYYAQFNYTKKDGTQASVKVANSDKITITFLDENGNALTKVPMWEYDESTGKYYSLVWYIADYELTIVEADQYVWGEGPNGWGNQYDTEGDKREKCTAAVYTLKKVRAVDLICEYANDTKTYSYSNANHANCTWNWSRNGQTFTALQTIYLDEEKTVKLQAPVGVGKSNDAKGYTTYVDQLEATGNKIVVANLKDLDFQTHYSDYNSKSLWTLATNLQCLWYPDTVVHVASGVGGNIREVEFEGLEVIGCQMFRGNKYITEFRVPNKCEFLNDEVFRESGIKTIRYGESIKIVANAALSGITPTTYYISSNILSDSYLTGFTNTAWDYGYIINSSKATVYFTGTKAEAEAFWAKLAADNSSYTEVYYYDYNEVTERANSTGMAIFYNYNRCDAFYKGEHEFGTEQGKFLGVKYITDFVVASTCDTCKLSNVTDTVCGPLFTTKGYSKAYATADDKNDGAITFGIVADLEAIAAYNLYTGQEIRYGIVAAPSIDGGVLVGNDGNVVDSTKVLGVECTGTKYSILQIKIAGISTANYDSKVHCSAYVVDKPNGEESATVTYISADAQTNIGIATDTAGTISHSTIKDPDEE